MEEEIYDIREYLPVSRQFFRIFYNAHLSEYHEIMINARVGRGTGYSNYYRDNEVTQHIRDIYHNLQDGFGNVTIPCEFPSPEILCQSWKAFYSFLESRNELFEDVLSSENPNNLPFPFFSVQRAHRDTLAALKELIGMPEVEAYLKKGTAGLKSNFDIAIITALYDTELEAFKKKGITLNKYPILNDSTLYHTLSVAGRDVLLATDNRMGMAAAAALSTKLIANFSPKYIIMAGIAAGVKDNEKKYGDILVAKYTWNYDSGKYKFDTKTGLTIFEPDPEQIELDATISHIITEFKSNNKILKSIYAGFKVGKYDKKPERSPKVFMGPMASGSAVVADERKIESLRRNYRKLIGIDMETFGVFYAAKSFSTDNVVKAISIKSVSDFADMKKNDKYRNYAAYTSASFILELIEELP